MLPIFILGVVMGGIVVGAIITFKKEAPTQTRLDLLNLTIDRFRKDNDLLMNQNKELTKQIELLRSISPKSTASSKPTTRHSKSKKKTTVKSRERK